jgi:hypothetical protein
MFKTVFKILNWNMSVKFFFRRWFNALKVRETLCFQHTFELWKQPEVNYSEVRRVKWIIHGGNVFPTKNYDTEAKNMPLRCRDEESMSDLSTTPRLRLTASRFSTSSRRMINSGLFRYTFEADDTPEAGKADQHCFNLGLWYPWLLWSGDSS